ncbi:hypothetical protein [Micromonospora sp. KC721]|nr:hypothetical protein [Micromonospora sp. KC721]
MGTDAPTATDLAARPGTHTEEPPAAPRTVSNGSPPSPTELAAP